MILYTFLCFCKENFDANNHKDSFEYRLNEKN